MKKENIKNLILTFSLIAAFNAASSALPNELNTLKNVSFTKISDNNVEITINTEYGLKEIPKIFEKDKNSYFIALDSTYYKGKKALNIDNIKKNILSATAEYIPYKSKPNEGYTKISIITTDDTLLSVAKLPFNPENRKFKKLIRLLLVLLGSGTIVGSGIVVSLTLQNKKRISGLSELDKTEDFSENNNNQTQILNINPEALDYINDSIDLNNFPNNSLKEEEDSTATLQNEDPLPTEEFNADKDTVESNYQTNLETKNNTIGENNMYPSPDDIVNDVLASEETVTELSKIVLNKIEDNSKDYTLISTEKEIDEVFANLDNEEKNETNIAETENIQDDEGLNNFFNEEEPSTEYPKNDDTTEEIYENEEPAEVIEETYQEEVYRTEESTEVVEEEENNIDFKSVQYTPTSGISVFTPKTFVFSSSNTNETEEPAEIVEEAYEETYEEDVYEPEEPAEIVEEAYEETYEEEVYETEEPAEVVEEAYEETYEEEVYETEEPAEVVEEAYEETYEEEVYETEEPAEVVEEGYEETYEEEVYETEEPAEIVEEEIENNILEDIFDEIETTDEDLESIEDVTEEIYEIEEPTQVIKEEKEILTISEEISYNEISKAKETFDNLAIIMNDKIIEEKEFEEVTQIEETTLEETSQIYNARENIIDTLFQDEANQEIQNENIFSEFNIGGFDGIIAEMPTEEELSFKKNEEIIEENEITYEEHPAELLTEPELTFDDEVIENLDEITELQDNELPETNQTYEEALSSPEIEEYTNTINTPTEIIIDENIEKEEDMMQEETPISTEKFFVENDEEENNSDELFKNEYSYESSENNVDNDDIFFDDEDTTEELDDSEPIVVSEKEIENKKQLYLIRHEGKYSLIGTIENEVFVIHKFDEKPTKTRITSKLNESKPNQHIYIVKVDTWRALISITDKTMENLLTLS